MPGRSRRAKSTLALAPLAAVLFALGLLAPATAAADAPVVNVTSSSALSPELEALATPAVQGAGMDG